jgi:hypothetical protein
MGLIIVPLNRIGLSVLGLALSLASGMATADVVAVVSSKSPVTMLSRSQVTDIFLGKAMRFPDGVQAVPIDQEEGSPARDEFYATFAGKSPAQIKAHWSKIIFTGRGRPPKAVANSAEVKKLIVDNLSSISYIDRTLVDSSVRVVFAP